jgi:DNA-binding response OmpR family regulator
MERVLVVEDNRALQKALERLFRADSLEVSLAADGVAASESFRAQPPTAVVLDLKLPGRNGRDLCREFKAQAPHVPIVILSADSEVEDKVLLLELGADDYVTKPFSPRELLARVRRAIRRAAEQRAMEQLNRDVSKPMQHEVLEFGNVKVDFTTMEAEKGGTPVMMTAQEFKLLRFLAQSPGKVISRDELLNEVWGYTNYPSTRTVDNHILRLRQKLEDDASDPRHLLTVYGAGYKFVPIVSSARAVV